MWKRAPRIVLALVEGLPDDGQFAASIQGGREFNGWGVDRHMAANLWDLLAQVNTDPKKKAPEHPRPKSKNTPPKGAMPFRALIGRDL